MQQYTIAVIKQFLAGVAASMSVFIAGAWLGWISPALKKITYGETSIELSNEEISWVVALMDLGNFLSPIPAGYLADSLGRKYTLLLTAFLYQVTWLLTICGKSFWYLVLARLGAGIGKGVAFTVVPMYLGEIAGVRVRGAVSTIFTGLLYSGILFEYSVGPFVTYDALNIISGIIPVIFFTLFFLFPDSPYIFLMKNKHDKAKSSLSWFRHCKANDAQLEHELDQMEKTVQKQMAEKGRFKDLIATPGNRRALTIVMVLSAFQRLGGISPMLAYTVITLPKSGGFFSAEIYMIWFGITMVVGNFIGTPLIDILGRKPLLIVSCSSCALLTGISTIFFTIAGPANDLEGYNWIPYLCFLFFGMSYSIGIGVIPSTFVGELFPANIKSYASAISAMFFAIASFSINKVYLFVKHELGVNYMFGFFTCCSIFVVVFTIFYVFETKGKPFEEIQSILHKKEIKNESKRTEETENAS